jgi:hypothetical protein
MSVLSPVDGPSYWDRQAWLLGEKVAADQVVAYNLAGRLYVSDAAGKPWGLLSVPNAMVRGIFSAMQEPGIELPLRDDGQLDAHISVFRPEEIAILGGADALLNDRGKVFHYTIGRLVSVEPDGWPDVSKCWMLRIHSPELQALRRSYGLSGLPKDGEYDFHITTAVRRRGVLGRGETAKNTAAA